MRIVFTNMISNFYCGLKTEISNFRCLGCPIAGKSIVEDKINVYCSPIAGMSFVEDRYSNG